MLDSLEQFLTAVRNGEFSSEDLLDYQNPRIDTDLSQRLARLGICYTYSGMLQINPMAIRVLDRMQVEGKSIDEGSFMEEILESKNSYILDHLDPSENENFAL